MNRYPFTEAEDAGLGADEFEGPRRFTRPVERIVVDSTLHRCCGGIGRHTRDCEDVLDPRVRVRMLDRAADLLHDVVLETPSSAQHRELLRDLAQAVKDLADDIGAEMTAPEVHPAKNVTSGETNSQKENR